MWRRGVCCAMLVGVGLGGCASASPAAKPTPERRAAAPVALPSPNLLVLVDASGQPLIDDFEGSRNDHRLGSPPPELVVSGAWDRWVFNRQDVLYGRTQSTYRSLTRLREAAER